MRCKNCGSENDENLYICQNCGSPLYDEDDTEQQDINENSTMIFNTVAASDNKAPSHPERRSNQNQKKEAEKKNQTIIIIAVLAIVLILIIAGTLIAVLHNKNTDNSETISQSDTIPEETSDYNNNDNNNYITEKQTSSTEKPSTSKQTTESTTKETTTKIKTFNVSLSCNDGGEVEGDGTYKRGDNITVIARPDDGYDFDGWYKGDKKVSSNTKYTFTVTDNTNLQAVFVIVNNEPIDIIDGGDD